MDFKELAESDREKIRSFIRELMLEPEIQEHDLIAPSKKQWKDEVAILRTKMTDLLKNIEDDNYREGLDQIDTVIFKLKRWKREIQKFL